VNNFETFLVFAGVVLVAERTDDSVTFSSPSPQSIGAYQCS
jgi:hypothetical protein